MKITKIIIQNKNYMIYHLIKNRKLKKILKIIFVQIVIKHSLKTVITKDILKKKYVSKKIN